jgi:hypothetical protein
MVRPKSSAPKTQAIQIRLTPEEKESFDRLVALRAEELRGQGIDITGASVIRWLIAEKVAERGLDKPTPSKPASARKPPSSPKGAKAR